MKIAVALCLKERIFIHESWWFEEIFQMVHAGGLSTVDPGHCHIIVISNCVDEIPFAANTLMKATIYSSDALIDKQH